MAESCSTPKRVMAATSEFEALDPDFAAIGHAKLVATIAEHEIAERAVARGAPYDEARARAHTPPSAASTTCCGATRSTTRRG